MTLSAQAEIARGSRFGFGDNWRRFLDALDAERIAHAIVALRDLAGDLTGLSWLDIGSGSGLHSLAALRLGAAHLHSFDHDPKSVACTRELARRYAITTAWTIEQGSALDEQYLGRLGTFDVVYSWGVLHHTGDLWSALDLAATAVAPGGRLIVALYRDEGWRSRAWLRAKRLYNTGGIGRAVVGGSYVASCAIGAALRDVARLRDPRRRYAEYKRNRGMSQLVDWIDWIGGLPFEVASSDQVTAWLARHRFALTRLTRSTGHGCNEYVFERR